jgi:glyoxylase-like metal-dependent hydrolase (beta-lactamase superfamily II)
MTDWIETPSPRIRVIPGGNGGRFPYSHTVFIDDDVKAVIDTGAGEAPLRELLRGVSVDRVVNTHFHFDHIFCNYLFEGSEILLNRREADCFRDRRAIARFLGIAEVYGEASVENWLGRISDPRTGPSPYSPQNDHRWWLSSARIDGTYDWGGVLDFGKTRARVIGAPGHSEGFCCLFFEEEGIAYVSDIDLTAFGPWYGGTDGDIEGFARSCREMAALGARHYITGHEKGMVDGKAFREGVGRFLSKIDEREKRILEALRDPLTLEELADLGLVYPRRFHEDAWVRMWNYLMTKKHVLRLAGRGEVGREEAPDSSPGKNDGNGPEMLLHPLMDASSEIRFCRR